MRSNQVAQDFIQLGLKNLQRLRLCSLFGQSVQLPDYPHGENDVSYIKLVLPLFALSALSCPPVIHHLDALSNLLRGIGKLQSHYVNPHQAFPFPNYTTPALLLSSYRGDAPGPGLLDGPSLSSLQINNFLVTKTSCRCNLMRTN